jgi:hypothetical protein
LEYASKPEILKANHLNPTTFLRHSKYQMCEESGIFASSSKAAQPGGLAA